MKLSIYTDGACVKNPGGPGAWAFVVPLNPPEFHFMNGYSPCTTNNIMEMAGVLEAIKYAKARHRDDDVTIFSDSQYVVKGINEWMPGWKKRGWRKKGGPIKNLDLWQEIDSLLSEPHNLKFQWVRGHAGHKWNEIADELCSTAIMQNNSSEDVSQLKDGLTDIPEDCPDHIRHIIEFRNKVYQEKYMKYSDPDKLDREFEGIDVAIYQVLVDGGFGMN